MSPSRQQPPPLPPLAWSTSRLLDSLSAPTAAAATYIANVAAYIAKVAANTAATPNAATTAAATSRKPAAAAAVQVRVQERHHGGVAAAPGQHHWRVARGVDGRGVGAGRQQRRHQRRDASLQSETG